ncbi:MAG: DNA-directed RNA polymerase subunit N [Candidatus Thermoplasmatota archaeon]|nr:DNA-directed RNA polymerase subunit N [Candidatus Thermoplasmatota archaeon]
MILLIRCYSCGKVIGSAAEQFQERVKKGEKPKEVLDSLGVSRYCCRRMILAQFDIAEESGRYF